MIKTKINRHDLEYYLYAMIKAFYPKAPVLAPDTAEHNIPEDEEGENEDIISCSINEDEFEISINKGLYFTKDYFEKFSIISKSEENEFKDEIRGYIYDVLTGYTERKLEWGNLTGIRPTKLYLNKMIEEQKKINENDEYPDNISMAARATVIEDMMRIHSTLSKKGNLAADIALTEKKIIDGVHTNNGYSLYIGIPFCPSRCLYCSFTSNPIFMYKACINDYINALKKEITVTNEIMKDYFLDSIYIGGGTPTALSASEIDELLGIVTAVMPMDNVKEFTVEAGRPDSITKEKLEVIRKYPVTRISINPQTMKDETLRLIGRNHSVSDFENAYEMARKAGFDNINMDIILGLPGETIEDVKNTIDKIITMTPDSLTVHSLAIKRASRLKEVMDEMGDIRTLDFDEAMDYATTKAMDIGLIPYYLYRQKEMGGNLENTGFASKGKFGIYNIVMMEEVQSIVACGAGTVTKRVFDDGHIERCDTVKDVGLYISKIEEMIDRKRQLFKD